MKSFSYHPCKIRLAKSGPILTPLVTQDLYFEHQMTWNKGEMNVIELQKGKWYTGDKDEDISLNLIILRWLIHVWQPLLFGSSLDFPFPSFFLHSSFPLNVPVLVKALSVSLSQKIQNMLKESQRDPFQNSSIFLLYSIPSFIPRHQPNLKFKNLFPFSHQLHLNFP